MVSQRLEAINVSVTALRAAHKAGRKTLLEVESNLKAMQLEGELATHVERALGDLFAAIDSAVVAANLLDLEAIRLDELEA